MRIFRRTRRPASDRSARFVCARCHGKQQSPSPREQGARIHGFTAGTVLEINLDHPSRFSGSKELARASGAHRMASQNERRLDTSLRSHRALPIQIEPMIAPTAIASGLASSRAADESWTDVFPSTRNLARSHDRNGRD